jgi:GTP cyclohydrolase I
VQHQSQLQDGQSQLQDGQPNLSGLAEDELDLDARQWAAVSPRHVSPEEWERFEGYMEEIFAALGMPMGTPSTNDTPRRFLRALFDATSGYEGDDKLITAFPTECRAGPDCRISQVVEGPVPFFSLCEHHSLPFIGQAYVGYVAHENILGLSKLTRLVRLFARRFSVQERIGQQLAGALERVLTPTGWPSIWRPCTCAPRCAVSGRPNPRPAPPLAGQLRRRPSAASRVLRSVQPPGVTDVAAEHLVGADLGSTRAPSRLGPDAPDHACETSGPYGVAARGRRCET